MRTQGSAAVRKSLSDAEASGALEEAFDALNVLGSTPWRVNRGVYDTMQAVGSGAPSAPPPAASGGHGAGLGNPSEPVALLLPMCVCEERLCRYWASLGTPARFSPRVAQALLLLPPPQVWNDSSMDFPDLPARADLPEPPPPSQTFRLMAGRGQLMAGAGELNPVEQARQRQLTGQVGGRGGG
jgi:hypothetical protein